MISLITGSVVIFLSEKRFMDVKQGNAEKRETFSASIKALNDDSKDFF